MSGSLSGLGSPQLLFYNATYRVLICRECKYAIQKSALESHLLRHKIYRNERAQLLASIAKLVLFEPQDVPLPHPTSPPIDGLPVTNGYRCTIGGCGNLCASEKRMRRHWSENHDGLKQGAFEECVREAMIQTFFRGTRLRYFEVNSSIANDTTPMASLPSTAEEENPHDDERYNEQDYDGEVDGRGTAAPPCISTASTAASKSSLGDLNLETLTYFHHFITATSFTLPVSKHIRSTTHYWPTDVVSLALRRRWLMHGLLALSACHMAIFAGDPAMELVHCERVAAFGGEFCSGWQEVEHNEGISDGAAESAGQQIMCLLQMANWAAYNALPIQHSNVPQPACTSYLQLFIAVVQNFNASEPALRPANTAQVNKSFAQSNEISITPNRSEPRSPGTAITDQTSLSALVHRLHSMPSLLTDAFGRPKIEDVEDVLHTISAIGSLIECFQVSFRPEDDEEPSNAADQARPADSRAAWRAMTNWLANTTKHFHKMIPRGVPSALVMLAHWALLVDRAERCGCWFLSGVADRIIRDVKEHFSGESDVVKRVVEGLLS